MASLYAALFGDGYWASLTCSGPANLRGTVDNSGFYATTEECNACGTHAHLDMVNATQGGLQFLLIAPTQLSCSHRRLHPGRSSTGPHLLLRLETVNLSRYLRHFLRARHVLCGWDAAPGSNGIPSPSHPAWPQEDPRP
eukprot:CAMPEP_0117604654 /NCGR_PEP_ID=MMETSP0784-20121206/78797_1 /TAXON_ID=39447 /ORGANISM="" /LENGTH=138 /DNA_ID=CAMNT_0005407689 /DNA_START=772 /DNA_END=1189 /DNA_ORIENTATION=-